MPQEIRSSHEGEIGGIRYLGPLCGLGFKVQIKSEKCQISQIWTVLTTRKRLYFCDEDKLVTYNLT